jgi:hypothetical protein
MATAAAVPVPDFLVLDHGSVVILMSMNDDAQTWFDEHVSCKCWRTWGPRGVAVDPRYVDGLVEGMIEEGFTVQ